MSSLAPILLDIEHDLEDGIIDSLS